MNGLHAGLSVPETTWSIENWSIAPKSPVSDALLSTTGGPGIGGTPFAGGAKKVGIVADSIAAAFAKARSSLPWALELKPAQLTLLVIRECTTPPRQSRA